MPRAPRIDVGGEIYHVINRANNRAQIFRDDNEYQHFEKLLVEAKERTHMRIYAYVLMPNHWHLVIHPRNDGDLSVFMQWLTLTHVQQYRAATETIGNGHLYQGRYKSFIVEKEGYFIQLIRYVEQNPFRANLVTKSENWKWGSAWRRYFGNQKEKELLDSPPIALPSGYRSWLNEKEKNDQLSILRNSVNRGVPFGGDGWVQKKVVRYKLAATLRPKGRPRKQ